MKIRKKMLSVFCAAMLLGTITSVTVPQVQASEGADEKSGWFLSDHAGECIRHKSR